MIDLDYSKFVGLVNERNRPSGGIKTIQQAMVNARVSPHSKVLEIGSNTGFTSVNINLLTGADVVGVDINQPSVDKAKNYAKTMGSQASFQKIDATNLPFEADSFDLLWVSNVTSFIADKQKAIAEYLRVLKPGGTLVAVPIYYRKNPPDELVKKISTAINSKIDVWGKEYWLELYSAAALKAGLALELYYEKDFAYKDQSANIEDYIKTLISEAPGAHKLGSYRLSEIVERAQYFYTLFNESNFKYAGYSVLLFQKRAQYDQIELFTTREV